MEKQIKEIQNYFISKILNDEFEIVKMEEHTCSIKVDGKYDFIIWMANEPRNRRPYYGHGNYFMTLAFNEKQALKCSSIFEKRRKQFNEVDLKNLKMMQYKKLQKELGITSNI